MEDDKRLSRFLGWFSVGLGLTQLVATRTFAQAIGIQGGGISQTILRMVGAREIGAGQGILRSGKPTGWIWSRVIGDVMDLALLGRALASGKNNRSRLAAATAAVIGIAVLDVREAQQLTRKSALESGESMVRKSIIVNRPVEEVYAFWHDFENLPRFMRHLESVKVTGDGSSHWKAKAPVGQTVEWDAEIVTDRPNEIIAWHSIEGSDVDNSGSVLFTPAPAGRGTYVTVDMRYDAPGGPVGRMIAKLTGEEPSQQIAEDLRIFRQVMETGQVTVSEATVGGTHFPQRPAQPTGVASRKSGVGNRE